MNQVWHLIHSACYPAAFNMGLDEALLLTGPEIQTPILRFYGWSEPAATFGLFQKFTDVSRWTSIPKLIRRPTGGGLVSHLQDWTYSIVIPRGSPWYELTATTSYQHLHQWLQSAFQLLEVETALAPHPRGEAPGSCFVGADQYDLLWHGRKIAGAAQRRLKSGLLIQGSVQFPGSQLNRNDWQKSVRAVLERNGSTLHELNLSPALLQLASQLAEDKYSQDSHNQRR